MRFLFEGGDGDQSYFSKSFIAERVFEPWFPDVIERGSAYLLKVLTGPHQDEYLAITSRVVASLEDQIAIRNYISVVVHTLRNPGPGFVASPENLFAIGMAAIEVLKPPGPAILANPFAHPSEIPGDQENRKIRKIRDSN
jgi:hypothetical protein